LGSLALENTNVETAQFPLVGFIASTVELSEVSTVFAFRREAFSVKAFAANPDLKALVRPITGTNDK